MGYNIGLFSLSSWWFRRNLLLPSSELSSELWRWDNMFLWNVGNHLSGHNPEDHNINIVSPEINDKKFGPGDCACAVCIDHTCDVHSTNYRSLLFHYGFLQWRRWRAGERVAFHPVWGVSHVTGPTPSIILFWPLNWLQTNCCDLRASVMLCDVLLKYNTCHYISHRLPCKPTPIFLPSPLV